MLHPQYRIGYSLQYYSKIVLVSIQRRLHWHFHLLQVHLGVQLVLVRPALPEALNGSIKSLCFAVESFLGEVRVFDDFVSVHDLEHVFSFLEFVNI